jgi:hypothetical protein
VNRPGIKNASVFGVNAFRAIGGPRHIVTSLPARSDQMDSGLTDSRKAGLLGLFDSGGGVISAGDLGVF